MDDQKGPLLARDGFHEVASGGDAPGSAVRAVVDETRAGSISCLDAHDLGRDSGEAVGPVGHCGRDGENAVGGRVQFIGALEQPGRGGSRREESSEWRRR